MIKLELYENWWIQFQTNNRKYLEDLYEYFSDYVDNYFYMPKYKAGIWNGKSSVFIKNGRLLPYGLLVDFLKFHTEYYNELKLNISDDIKKKFKGITDINWNWNQKFKPRYYQEDAVKSLIKNKSGIVISSTASGKSLIISYIYSHLMDNNIIKKPLLIVPRIDLVKQFKNDLIDYNFNSGEIGCVWGEIKEFDKDFTISTWQSLQLYLDEIENNDKNNIFLNYDSITIDEVHKVDSRQLNRILKECKNAHYRFGLTGTMPESKLNQWNVKSFIGPILKEYKIDELRKNGFIAECKIKIIFLNHSKKELKSENEIIDKNTIFISTKKQNLLTKLAENTKDKAIVFLVDKIEKQGKILEKNLKNNYNFIDRDIVFIYGGMKSKKREEWYTKCKEGKNIILICNYSVFQEGINIPNLEYIVFASPATSKIRVMQSIGRVLRLYYSKNHAKVYDIVDKNTGIKSLESSSRKREMFYNESKFPIEYINL